MSNLPSFLYAGVIFRYPADDILQSCPHLSESAFPPVFPLPEAVVHAPYHFQPFLCRRIGFLWDEFSILGAGKSHRGLCWDCTKAGETARYCVLLKMGAQCSMNAQVHYRVGEASHCLTKTVVFGILRTLSISHTINRRSFSTSSRTRLILSVVVVEGWLFLNLLCHSLFLVLPSHSPLKAMCIIFAQLFLNLKLNWPFCQIEQWKSPTNSKNSVNKYK